MRASAALLRKASCQQLAKPVLLRRSTQPGFSAPWRLLEQVERTEVFLIQSDVLNTEVQRLSHAGHEGRHPDADEPGIYVGGGAHVSGRTLGGGLGLGILGAAISQSSPYVGMAFGYYGLPWSVYSTVIWARRRGGVREERHDGHQIRSSGAGIAVPA